MAKPSIAERLAAAEAKHERAKERWYDLLGWGESTKVEAANRSMIRARKEVEKLDAMFRAENTCDFYEESYTPPE